MVLHLNLEKIYSIVKIRLIYDAKYTVKNNYNIILYNLYLVMNGSLSGVIFLLFCIKFFLYLYMCVFLHELSVAFIQF